MALQCRKNAALHNYDILQKRYNQTNKLSGHQSWNGVGILAHISSVLVGRLEML